jgi:hypothetical protein
MKNETILWNTGVEELTNCIDAGLQGFMKLLGSQGYSKEEIKEQLEIIVHNNLEWEGE